MEVASREVEADVVEKLWILNPERFFMVTERRRNVSFGSSGYCWRREEIIAEISDECIEIYSSVFFSTNIRDLISLLERLGTPDEIFQAWIKKLQDFHRKHSSHVQLMNEMLAKTTLALAAEAE